MGIATLGGMKFRTGPSDISWDFQIKYSEGKGLSGKVVQILGSRTSNMIVKGQFSGNRKNGQEDWQEQLAFREQVKEWARGFEAQRNPEPIQFTYPPRGWDFQVYIKAFSSVRMAVDEVAPTWTLELFLVDEDSRKMAKGIRDVYIKRLMEGVGWKQSGYNGGSERNKQRLLAGRSITQFLGDLAEDAYNGDL